MAAVTIAVSNSVFDLTIGKDASANVPATSNLVYTISVTNKGPSSADSVTVTDVLPAGASFVSATGNWATNGGTVTWSLGTLTSGQVSNVKVMVAAPASGTLTNVASVGPLPNDPNPANNVTPPVITVVTPLADVGFGRSGPPQAVYGANFNYTILVTNFGPSTASSVSVTDSVPAGLDFVAASAGATTNGNQVVWTNLGSLVSGATTNLTLTVDSSATGTLTNIVSSSSATPDPNLTNNEALPIVTTITRALPAVTWPMPTNIVYGTPLGTNQNDAAALVPGSYVYNPTNGTTLTAGTNFLHVLFTPTDTNYETTNLSVQLVVLPALLTVSANNTNKVYGTELVFLGSEFTVSGLVSTDEVNSASISSMGAGPGAGAGSYAINITNVVGDTGLTNYLVTYEPGMLTVNQAVLGVSANDTNRLYGQTNPVFTASYSGFVNGDTPGVLNGTLVVSSEADTNSPVGDYPIVAGGLISTNYALSFTNGTLMVNPTTLTITAENTNKIYGQTVTFAGTEFTSSGSMNGDTVNSVALSSGGAMATAGVAGSPYAINATNASGSGLTNYTISYQPGILTVQPPTLTVTADDKSRIYTLANPPLTASFSGFVNNENTNVLNGSPALSTTANPSSPVGDYPINITQDTLGNANYNFLFVDGTLTVTPAPTPVITSIDLTNGIANIMWTSFTGVTYQVHVDKNNLAGSNWIDLLPDITATGATAAQTNILGSVSQRFYRIMLLPP